MLFRNIAETLPINARRRPDHPAIICGGRTIDYAGLTRQVGQTAGLLAEMGVSRGDIVGVALKDSPEHLIAMLAIAHLGAVILPMDCRWAPQEKNNLADWFVPVLVLVDAGSNAIGSHRTVELDAGWENRVAATDPNAAEMARDDDMGLLLSLSSGTTGRPKGPMLTHRLLQNRFIQHWSVLGFHEQDRHLVSTPLYFGGGRVFALSHLFIGATVVLLPLPYTPEELITTVANHDISTMFIVPTMLRRLLGLPASDHAVLKGPRYVISGGSALHQSERAAALQRISPRLVNYYSSSEGGAVSILLPSHGGAAADSVGRPVFMTEVEVVDKNDSNVASGEIGMVRYRGPGVPSELYRDPEESRAMFRDGWFYPGDLGRIEAGGFLYLTGRAKDLIIRGGVNIYPQDVESTILKAPGVEDVAVVGWPSAAFGEEVAAFVVARHGADATAIIAHCRVALASYKVPREVFFVEALPKNSSGKILKKELASRLVPIG